MTTMPVTEAVRNHAGDYVEAVENLEASHAELLEALRLAQEVMDEGMRGPDGARYFEAEKQARAAIAKATGG